MTGVTPLSLFLSLSVREVGKMKRWATVLVFSGCYNRMLDWMAYKQKFSFHGFGGWEIQN